MIYFAVNTTLYINSVKIEKGLNRQIVWSPYNVESSVVNDCSGFGNDGILNTELTISADTSRYDNCSYFGEYNTPSITLNNTSLLPALSSCTITWWGKYDTVKTLLLTGQSTSYYLAASNDNKYYHQNGGSNIVVFKNGIQGTYKCTAGTWDFFVLKNVDLSTWTALKLNGYGAGWPLKGYISDFRIYSTALSDSDILELYNTGALIDNEQNVRCYEFQENTDTTQSRELMYQFPVDNGTSIRIASDMSYNFTGKASYYSGYIPINPTNKTYYYDIEFSMDDSNWFLIGFERFDSNKQSGSNSECQYVVSRTAAINHARVTGTVNLSTANGNTAAYTRLRILNDWNNSGNSYKATIYHISLKEVSSLVNSNITKQGQVQCDNFVESDQATITKYGNITANQLIEI